MESGVEYNITRVPQFCLVYRSASQVQGARIPEGDWTGVFSKSGDVEAFGFRPALGPELKVEDVGAGRQPGPANRTSEEKIR